MEDYIKVLKLEDIAVIKIIIDNPQFNPSWIEPRDWRQRRNKTQCVGGVTSYCFVGNLH